MSVGGPYALACAARHPDRVTAVGVVAAPGPTTELDPPVHRDDLSPSQQAFVTGLASISVDEAAELMRPEFERFVAGVAPEDDRGRGAGPTVVRAAACARTPHCWPLSRPPTSRPRCGRRWRARTATCATPP